jgi:hypothetical protein
MNKPIARLAVIKPHRGRYFAVHYRNIELEVDCWRNYIPTLQEAVSIAESIVGPNGKVKVEVG